MVSVAGDVADSLHSAGRGRWVGRSIAWIVREPFFQFVALGALLFAASEYLEARANFARIDITRSQVEGITNNYRLQYGASPTAEQLNGLVDQFVKEEVFYHEALRLKLDRDDEIIRRRLVQKYEFLQQDLGTPKDPSEPDLRAFYQSHTKNYEIPERLTFSHVFFSIDRDGDNAAKARAERVLAALNQRRVTRAPDSGDAFPGAFDYAAQHPPRCAVPSGRARCPRRYSRSYPAIGRVRSVRALAGISCLWRRMSRPESRPTTMRRTPCGATTSTPSAASAMRRRSRT